MAEEEEGEEEKRKMDVYTWRSRGEGVKKER